MLSLWSLSSLKDKVWCSQNVRCPLRKKIVNLGSIYLSLSVLSASQESILSPNWSFVYLFYWEVFRKWMFSKAGRVLYYSAKDVFPGCCSKKAFLCLCFRISKVSRPIIPTFAFFLIKKIWGTRIEGQKARWGLSESMNEMWGKHSHPRRQKWAWSWEPAFLQAFESCPLCPFNLTPGLPLTGWLHFLPRWRIWNSPTASSSCTLLCTHSALSSLATLLQDSVSTFTSSMPLGL